MASSSSTDLSSAPRKRVYKAPRLITASAEMSRDIDKTVPSAIDHSEIYIGDIYGPSS